MKQWRRTVAKAGAAIAAAAALVWPSAASACAVCYGEPDSPAARGLTWAILVLGGVVVSVLAGVVGFFVQANRKASAAPVEGEAGRLE